MPTENKLKGVRIGYALAGSFCTFEKSFKAAEKLRNMGAELLPIMSYNAAGVDTRFGKAEENIRRLEDIAGRKVIKTIEDAEPIGPKRMCDVMVVAPCTANSAAKLAVGITDTPLTMAVKNGAEYTDDCAAVEAMGIPVRLSKGSPENIKITRPLDIQTAEAILKSRGK